MIKLIIGKKGSGKTKKLVDFVNEATAQSLGNVVCIEKGDTLTYSVTHKARLIDADSFGIAGYGEYYGMIAGIKSGNNDVTHIFGDATLRIGTRNYDELVAFLERVKKIEDVEFLFTVSADKEELPEKLFEIAELCKKTGEPIYLTKNGEGDLVVMDIEAFTRREKMLALREELLAVEADRIAGVKDITLEELSDYLDEVIGG